MLDRRRALALLAVLPLAGCGARQAGGKGGALAEVRRAYEEAMSEHGFHEWARYAGESKGTDDAAAMGALREREKLIVARANAACAQRACGASPREAELWARASRGLTLLGDPESVKLGDDLEKTINDFPFEVDGTRVKMGELRRMARSPDPAARRAQRRSMGALHAAAAPTAKALLKRRSAVARESGLSQGFYAALLDLRGISRETLSTLFGSLEQHTRPAFRDAIDEARRRGGLSRILPWDLEFLVKKLGDVGDERFPAEGALPFARAVFGDLGVDLDNPRVRIDVRDFAFAGQTISVRVPSDVRTVIRPAPGPGFWSTLLHELGHAFAATRNTEDNPVFRSYEWVPGMTEPGYEEGMAEVFGRALDEAPVLAKYVPQIGEAERGALLRARSRGEVIGIRQRLAFIAFEQAALRDPEQDLDALSRRLDREIVGLEVPEDTEPTWATSPFLATYPVYTQSYVLAAMFSSQVRDALRARLGGSWVSREGGAILARELVADGSRTTMEQKLQRLAKAPFSADAYVAWLSRGAG